MSDPTDSKAEIEELLLSAKDAIERGELAAHAHDLDTSRVWADYAIALGKTALALQKEFYADPKSHDPKTEP